MTIKIDFFSDTNTNPSIAMREAMAKAAVGNEAAGEDPTVNALIEATCTLLDKPAGLFLPSGTMCNVIAYKVHIQQPGDYLILDSSAHALVVQSGFIAAQAHATPLPIKGRQGIFTADQITPFIAQPTLRNVPSVRLVSMEQTTNFGGGAIWPLTYMETIATLCKQYDVATHLDGARLFNAAVATNIPPKAYAACFDSLFVDFSKGLGAPMGAVLVGSKAFIEKAWYYKFQIGGGMHQAGMLAAACLYALQHHIDALKEDHKKISYLLKRLHRITQLKVNPSRYKTNIAYFSLASSTLSVERFVELLKIEHGIRMAHIAGKIRVITHRDISYEAIDATVTAIQQIMH